MPAVIEPNLCDRQFHNCFPARMCPEDAFSQSEPDGPVLINDDLCGRCHGPCVNFCDQYAIRYALEPDEFKILKATTVGEMTEAEAAEERQRIKNEEAAAMAEQASLSPVVNATAESFDGDVLQSDLPVVVDFWAPWCGPCKSFAPVFEATASQYHESVTFVKVDTEAEPSLAMRYQVTSIPTLSFFWNGQLVDQVAGALSEEQFQSVVNQFVTAIRAHQEAVQQQTGQIPGAGSDAPTGSVE